METDASVHARAEERGSYGRGGFVVVVILLTLAILLFGVFAWVVGQGILQEGGRPATPGARVDAGPALQHVVGGAAFAGMVGGGRPAWSDQSAEHRPAAAARAGEVPDGSRSA